MMLNLHKVLEEKHSLFRTFFVKNAYFMGVALIRLFVLLNEL